MSTGGSEEGGGAKKDTMRSQAPRPSGVRSVPPPPPSARIPLPDRRPPPFLFESVPEDCTVRSLECWSIQGVAGQRDSDAFHARDALAHGARYGWNRMGQLVFVYRKGYGKVEYELQGRSPSMTRKTLYNLPVTNTVLKMCPKQEDTKERVEIWQDPKIWEDGEL